MRIKDWWTSWWVSGVSNRQTGRHGLLSRAPRLAGLREPLARLREPLAPLAAQLALRGRPLALRLVVVLLPLTLVATTFGLLRVTDARAGERPLADAQRYAAISRAAVTATGSLEDERDIAARRIGADGGDLDMDAVYAKSDRGLAGLEAAVGATGDPSLRFARDELRGRLDSLADLRRFAFTARLPATATVSRYSALILTVIQLGRTADSRAVLLAGDAGVAARTFGVYDLVIATGLTSQRRALGTALLARGRAQDGERGVVGGFGILVELQTDSFRSVAGPETLSLFQAAGVEAAAGDVDLFAQRIVDRSAGGDQVELSAQTWIELTSLYLDKARQVIQTSVDAAAAGIADLRAARADRTRANLAVVIAVLLGAVLMAVAVGYGLTTDLRRVRDRMRHISEYRLPRLVSAMAKAPRTVHLGEDDPARPARGGSPGRVPAGGDEAGSAPLGTDEIGQVARAFEGVHSEAVRLAGAQAVLRMTMAGLSRTLTRRTQELVARQLTLITQLEEREMDPANLNRLFELDHLATRIRRHGDNLLVLTGGAPAWRWPHPASLTEVVQAATAATEQYKRVEVTALPQVTVVATAIVDLIQILAELIDNATRFSPPDLPVRVTAGLLADGGVRIEVRDSGYGLGSRSEAALNARLSAPTIESLGDEPTLGLYVVGALTARTGVSVHLVPLERGSVAAVAVPAQLLRFPAVPTGDPIGDLPPLVTVSRESTLRK